MIRMGFKKMNGFTGFQVFKDDERTNISFSLSLDDFPTNFTKNDAYKLIKEALFCYLTGFEPCDPELYEFSRTHFEYEEFDQGEDFVSFEDKLDFYKLFKSDSIG